MTETSEAPSGKELAGLSLAAIGFVFGDMGTSPIYAFRESVHVSYGQAGPHANVLGVLSLISWSLVLDMAIKYLVFVLRAENEGEEGIIALTDMVSPPSEGPPTDRRKWRSWGRTPGGSWEWRSGGKSSSPGWSGTPPGPPASSDSR